MQEKKMKSKELKRKNLLDSIQRIEDFLMNFNAERDANEIAIRLDRLDILMETFESIQEEYEAFDDSDEFVAVNTKVRAKVEEQFFRVKGGLVNKLPPLPPTPVDSSIHHGSPAIPHATSVKLPTIELPRFDGDLNEWLTFHDSFSSLIHASPEIPCIQKFQYLRSALRGDALKLIESLTITENKYAVAWEALLNRYSNTYLLKKKHLQSLMVHSKAPGKSAVGLRAVVEDFERHVKILNQLGEPTEHWGSLLVQLLCSRVDDHTLKEWEEFVSAYEEPTYENLIDFLTRKVRTLESLHISAEQSNASSHGKHYPPVRQHKTQTQSSSKINSYAAVESYQPKCLACNDHHPLVKCPVFEKMQLKERLHLVNTKRICSNCFRSNHFVRNCSSSYSCKHCQKRHHSLLHPGFDASVSNNNPNSNGQYSRTAPNPPRLNDSIGVTTATTSGAISSNSAVESRGINVFLSTVVVKVLDGYGNEHLARALLDSGSQSSLMSDRLCQKLRLFRHRIDQPILGVGESTIRAVCSVATEVRSRVSDFSFPLNCLVLKKLTTDLPPVSIATTNWNIPNYITLADPEFNIARKVDLIIGAEHFYAILQGGRLQIGPQAPTLIESKFGWFVSGKACYDPMPQAMVCCTSTLETLNQNIEKFWKLDELDNVTLSPNDQYCEAFYKDTVTRDSTGRYSMKYPKKEGFETMIGESYSNAKSRLGSLERKLDQNPILKERYHAFMAEFIELGHMREVPMDEPNPDTVCFLPHHAVLKESSTTTKVRSVFDASAKTSTGFSLNDSLLVGPVIQDELFDILLRFRKNSVVLLADIEKMYRQIVLHPDDRPLLRVLWRFNKTDPITKYEMTTVTYGLGPSSFLATRTLHQLAEDESDSFPLAAAALKRDFYMDDFVRSEVDITTAIRLRK
ncbi:uncharacterized protein LOC129781531 [Toxorhynchites rutilus septentrionalis]|uniref:uncharacterized protein LOC129781531 n=1 Tax=Toxorhynchites rutilus septentrionalis TaxID=329112 RepID=UPI00247AABA3|nr:uncharacterized protein LOC129781531 [Toxorhynchites rutilus septentrionalis]